MPPVLSITLFPHRLQPVSPIIRERLPPSIFLTPALTSFLITLRKPLFTRQTVANYRFVSLVAMDLPLDLVCLLQSFVYQNILSSFQTLPRSIIRKIRIRPYARICNPVYPSSPFVPILSYKNTLLHPSSPKNPGQNTIPPSTPIAPEVTKFLIHSPFHSSRTRFRFCGQSTLMSLYLSSMHSM